MRRSGTAAPLRMTDEVVDTAHVVRLLAADLCLLRQVLDQLSEHIVLLRPDNCRWHEGDTE